MAISKKLKIWFWVIVSLLFGAAVILFFVAYPAYKKVFNPNVKIPEGKTYIYIKSDSNFMDLYRMLQDRKLLKDTSSFRWAAEQMEFITVKPGKYELKDKMSNRQLIHYLRAGNDIPVNVAIRHTWFIEDLASRLSNELEADSLEIIQLLKDDAYLAEKGVNQDNTLAFVIADTYQFKWHTSAKKALDRLHLEYKRVWNEERLAKAEKLGMSQIEVMSLAAIVAGETVKIDEAPKIAGLYLNRVRKGMMLQADPTIAYLIKKGDRNASTKRIKLINIPVDLRTSPFNTYRYKGIPPGPIFAPPVWAIDAVLEPESHDYIYMVAAIDKNRIGYHTFTKTIGDHNTHANKYRKAQDAAGNK